ncbi:LysR family transcriptional regulator [Massilia sp. KIM]|uniref:LysR family transcriptional regulator n=1 Tax=Massilia sp. KIM TaxID=1955422 RepID=UPI00098F2102|nr:LysR family transcriptional regulator [Massilia sp. KIM]OON62498.1 LysR family transcriptional regulator [Massilia sp. KIM]
MEIEELRTFVEIADAGGISPAAFRLGLSKSVVSRRLARLETELGVQLLSRSTRGAALTEAGLMFRNHALKACAEIDIGREATQSTGRLRGRVRIAAPATLGPTHFAPALAELARRHPDLHILTSYSDHIVDLIGEGFDCAIRLGFLQDSNLIARKIGSVPASIVASPSYVAQHGAPESTMDLLNHEALMRGTECWNILDGARIVSIHPQGRFKADNAMSLVAGAVAGLGIGYFPTCLVNDQLKSGSLVPVLTRYRIPDIDIFVLRPPSQHPSRKTRALIDFLAEQFTVPLQPFRFSRNAAEISMQA